MMKEKMEAQGGREREALSDTEDGSVLLNYKAAVERAKRGDPDPGRGLLQSCGCGPKRY